MKSIIKMTATAAFLLLGSLAQADLWAIPLDGTDCGGNGAFGNPCIIVDSQGNEISPFLGKWDSGDGEVTSDAGSDLGFDWDLMTFYYDEGRTSEVADGDWGQLFDQAVGGWSYAGADDLIRFWTAKAGSDFILYFYSDGDCSSWDNPDCLANAQPVTEGSWDTGLLESNLSHLGFYDGGSITVPEPGTLALLGLGLIGIGAARRRKAA